MPFEELTAKLRSELFPSLETSMDKVIAFLHGKIHEIENRDIHGELSNEEEAELLFCWEVLSHAVRNLSYICSQKTGNFSQLAKYIFQSTDDLEAKQNALITLAHADRETARTFAHEWLKDVESKKIETDEKLSVLLNSFPQYSHIDETAVNIARFIAKFIPRDQLKPEERVLLLDDYEITKQLKMIAQVLTIIDDHNAMPLLQWLMSSKNSHEDIIFAAQQARERGNPDLIPDLKQSLLDLESFFPERIEDFDNLADNKKHDLFDCRKAQIACAAALGQLGEKPFAVSCLKKWLNYCLKEWLMDYPAKVPDVSGLIRNIELFLAIAEKLVELGENELVIKKLSVYFPTFDLVNDRFYFELSDTHRIDRITRLHGCNIKAAKILGKIKYPPGISSVHTLWKSTIKYGTRYKETISLLPAVEECPTPEIVKYLRKTLLIFAEDGLDRNSETILAFAQTLIRLGDPTAADHIKYYLDENLDPADANFSFAVQIRLEATDSLIEVLALDQPRTQPQVAPSRPNSKAAVSAH
ncbi:MAG: hypothetical protein ABII23_09065 [bacterium]